ncbi:MAG: hypothetical protein ACR2RF_14780 [Geminicoccaceae bacterium]
MSSWLDRVYHDLAPQHGGKKMGDRAYIKACNEDPEFRSRVHTLHVCGSTWVFEGAAKSTANLNKLQDAIEARRKKTFAREETRTMAAMSSIQPKDGVGSKT